MENMKVNITVQYDEKDRLIGIEYQPARTEDPDGKTEIELLEIMSILFGNTNTEINHKP